jgi:hypothetical protein
MRVLVAALRALPVTFALYVVEAVLAITLTVPLGMELSSDARALGTRVLFRAAAIERGLQLLPALRVQGRALALGTVLLLLLTPLLSMTWLSALSGPLGVSRALEQGARLYLRACAVSLAVGLLLALALAPWALFAYSADTWIDLSTHARLHDLLLLGCVGTALPVLWIFHVAHDLARAFALRRGALASVRLGLAAAISLRAPLVALALFALGLLVGASPLLLTTAASRLGEMSSIALLQGACFGALGVRSLWLAYALTCTERYATSRVRGD